MRFGDSLDEDVPGERHRWQRPHAPKPARTTAAGADGTLGPFGWWYLTAKAGPRRCNLKLRHNAFTPLASGQQPDRFGFWHAEGVANRGGRRDVPLVQSPQDQHPQADLSQLVDVSGATLLGCELGLWWWRYRRRRVGVRNHVVSASRGGGRRHRRHRSPPAPPQAMGLALVLLRSRALRHPFRAGRVRKTESPLLLLAAVLGSCLLRSPPPYLAASPACSAAARGSGDIQGNGGRGPCFASRLREHQPMPSNSSRNHTSPACRHHCGRRFGNNLSITAPMHFRYRRISDHTRTRRSRLARHGPHLGRDQSTGFSADLP